MSSIDYGNGSHDLTGAYRLQNDGGQWFVMGNNMSVPCDSIEQADAIYERLTGRSYFDQGSDPKVDDGGQTQAPNPSGIGRKSFS